MLQVLLEARAQASFIAMVDSGASTSSFPLSVAASLGITSAELVENADGGVGVGSTFRIWSTAIPVFGQVIVNPPDGSAPFAWGPRFRLSANFIEPDVILLGRSDFFQAFTVTFEPGPSPPLFHLDH